MGRSAPCRASASVEPPQARTEATMSQPQAANPTGLVVQPGLEPVPGYRLVRRLGGGGYGEVWQADGPGGFPVALKFVRLGGTAAPVERRALDLLRGVRHSNLLA